MRLSVIEGSQETLVDLINPDRPEIFAVEDPLLGPMVRKKLADNDAEIKTIDFKNKTLKGVNFVWETP